MADLRKPRKPKPDARPEAADVVADTRPSRAQEISRSYDQPDQDLEATLYARHAEVQQLNDLSLQRGTTTPALFNQFYKFVQNPSSVSVETFKRMVDTDDTIGAGVDFLTICLAARIGRYEHASKEVSEWVNDRLDEIDGGFYNFKKSVLSATWAGFSCGEKVWANTENGFVVRKVVELPPSTVLFETDWGGELTADGILQYQRNYNPALQSGFYGGGNGFSQNAGRPDQLAKLGDLPFPIRTANSYNYLSIRIPRLKVIHYAFDAQGKFGNPYGRSLLRRCYKYYVMKDAFLQMLATALDRKGTPLTIVYASQNATVLDSTKPAAGNPRGNPAVGLRADVAARRIMENLHNDSAIVFPGKKGEIYDTDFVEQSSNQDAFIESLQFCNAGIMRALLVPALIFGSGDGAGSFALGQEHGRTFDKILDGMGDGCKQVMVQQLVREMLAYNFPESVWRRDGYGRFGKRELTVEEREKEMECFQGAVNIGAIDMQDLRDLNKIRESIGFDAREQPIAPAAGIFGDPMAADAEDPEADPKQEGNPFEQGNPEKQKTAPGAEARAPARPAGGRRFGGRL